MPESNAIVRPQDLATSLKDKVEHKIRDAFVDLITDEQWTAMTKAALEDFTTDKRINGVDHLSPFKKIVHEILKEKLGERIKKELEKPEYFNNGSMWRGDVFTETPGDAAKKIIEELAPNLMQALFGQIVQQCVNQIRETLQRGY